MAYRMPNTYSNDDEDYDSQDEESVDVSVDVESEYDESEAEGSEVEQDDDGEEEEEEDQRRPPRRGERSSAQPPPRVPPRRSKSFQEDTIRSRQQGGSGSGSGRAAPARTGSGGEGRKLPSRSQTFDGGNNQSSHSMRSLGGPRMARRDNAKPSSTLDRETIASNRARRLRAMGEGPKNGEVHLLRRSQSFRGPKNSSKSLMGEGGDDDAAAGGDGDDKGDGTRRGVRRSTSSDLSALAPEERQYARTAARGVTRAKSLRAERPNLEQASSAVATRLNRMRAAPAAGDAKSRNNRSNGDKTDDATKQNAAAPKTAVLQW